MAETYLPDTPLLRSLQEVRRQFKRHNVPLEHDISYFLEAFSLGTEKLSLTPEGLEALVKACKGLRDPDKVAAKVIHAIAEEPLNKSAFVGTDLDVMYLRSGVEQSLHALDGSKLSWGLPQPKENPEPEAVEPLAKKAVSFVERYFLHPSKLDVVSEFRHADSKRLCFKTGLVAAGAFALGDGIYIATQKDEDGNRHPYEGLIVGIGGLGGLAAGALMRGKPIGY